MYDLASTLLSIAPTNADRKEHFVIGGIKESLVLSTLVHQFSRKSYKGLGKKQERKTSGERRL